MPSCESQTSSGLTTTCCTTSNCNQLQIPAVVSRCYIGGTFADANTNSNITIPIVSKECLSPINKFCQVKIQIFIFPSKSLDFKSCGILLKKKVYKWILCWF